MKRIDIATLERAADGIAPSAKITKSKGASDQ